MKIWIINLNLDTINFDENLNDMIKCKNLENLNDMIKCKNLLHD
jgi:hypothetical protein